MKNVYVVSEGVDYEGSSPIRAFESKRDAENFVKCCYAYQRTRPEYPADDSEYPAWNKKREAWAKKHPGGEGSEHADYFSVNKIPFIGAAPKQEGASE